MRAVIAEGKMICVATFSEHSLVSPSETNHEPLKLCNSLMLFGCLSGEDGLLGYSLSFFVAIEAYNMKLVFSDLPSV